MRYLKLEFRPFRGTRDKKLTLDQELASKPLRDVVAENLFQVINVAYDKDKKAFQPKQFETLEDQKWLSKFKDSVVFTDGDMVEVSNELFEWIKKNFSVANFDGTSNDMLVGLSEVIDNAALQSASKEEERAAKEFADLKGKPMKKIKDFYTELGYKVTVTEKEEKS